MKNKKLHIILFILLILLSIIFLEKNRDYAIGEIILVEPLDNGTKDVCYAHISIKETSLDSININRIFSITSTKKLHLHDTVKLRFKYFPLGPIIITLTDPACNFSKHYYVDIIKRQEI